MQLEIKAGDAVRVTAAPSITGEPLLMLYVNDVMRGFVTKAAALDLRKVVKDPSKIDTGDPEAEFDADFENGWLHGDDDPDVNAFGESPGALGPE